MFQLARCVVLLTFAGLSLVAAEAWADCCRLVKIDPETPPATVRACTPDAAGGCGELLFEGTLALGQSQEVCSGGSTVSYVEYDDVLDAFGAAVEAICNGDVEL